MINQLEIFKSTTNHKKSDKYLFYAKFTQDLDKRIRGRLNLGTDINLQDYFDMFNPVMVSLKPPKKFHKPDYSRYFNDLEIPNNAFINHLGVLEIPGSMYHFTQYVSPLRNAQRFTEIVEFPYQDYSDFIEEGIREQVESAHQKGRVAELTIGHMYEDAWQIRGYEKFLEDMILNPKWCDYILDKIKERNIIMARAAARAGVDLLRTGDDVANQRAMMFSPDIWRRFIKVRWAEVFEAANTIKPDIQILYHSDGCIMKIIPELIEIGVTILNPVQPECIDPVEVKQKYGDKLVIDGTIGTQSVMPFGNPEDIKKVVNERIKLLGEDGALILSPTHILEPDVPIDNIFAFVESVKEINNKRER